MTTSKDLLEKYLKCNDININIVEYINVIDNHDLLNNFENESIFDNIIVDSYNGFSEDVKEISNYLTSNFGIFYGRKEKTIIKKILDYECYEDLKYIKRMTEQKIDLKKIIKQQRNKSIVKVSQCKEEFFRNLKQALLANDKNRVSDYLNFLYSRILTHNEYKERSIYEIFKENENYIRKEAQPEIINQLKLICKTHETKISYYKAVELFNKLYQNVILDSGKTLYEVITINLDQKLFDTFNNKEEFISYVFDLLKRVYKKIQNHRTLILKIENIISENNNIKWELYSYITIYAENFISYAESRPYFKPEDICIRFSASNLFSHNSSVGAKCL